MSSKNNKEKTPTEVLITVMENADDIKDILVIYKLKEDEDGNDGIAYHTTLNDLSKKLALVEEYKMLNIAKVYGLKQED